MYHQDKGKTHEKGSFNGYDHVKFWVGNAKQAAAYYCSHIGFEPYAYKGLETGERNIVCHVVRRNGVIFEFQSPLNPGNKEYARHQEKHGDAVKDLAFTVEDCASLIEYCKMQDDSMVVKDAWTESDDDGTVTMAVIKTYGDTTHTLVERTNYNGLFLPGYKKPLHVPAIYKNLPPTDFAHIDHCVGNQPDGDMLSVAKWYENNLLFHRFWSIDDDLMHTEYSALRSTVVTNFHETVYMPINEPAEGKRKSQIQEYCDYNDGPGVQHIALRSHDIISTIKNMRARGCEFLTIPDTYYEKLKENLAKSPVVVTQDLAILQKYKILVDFDDKGYLLQIFTKPMQDRPTFFLEVIQRHNHTGFGAGNFKTLFESIEIDQAARGNLTET